MKYKLLVAVLSSLLLVLSIINLIPDEEVEKGNYISCQNTKCTIDIGPEMKNKKEYHKIVRLLNTASDKTTIVFNISGIGGDVRGLLYLARAIENTKAKIKANVYGDVYSAHALLVLAFTDVTFKYKYSLVMFHMVSGTNMEQHFCQIARGIDRGLSRKQKCKENLRAIVEIYNKAILSYLSKVLTTKEQKYLLEGHDLYFSAEELQRRLK